MDPSLFVDFMPIKSRRLSLIASALLAIALILLLHRYAGIDHDAALYLGQALHTRRPDIFDQDLFFLHGSQGNYTLFPWLLGLSFDFCDPARVFLWGTLAGGVILGVAQALGGQINPGFQILAGHIVFLVVLALRPRGLFPKMEG